MRPGAIKCVKCSSYQDPVRRFIASGSSLWLLVALVGATSSWWAPALKEYFAPTGAIIKTSFGGTYGAGLGVSVTNVGTLPGTVQAVSFAMGNAKSLTTWPLRMQTNSLVIAPGATQVVIGELPLGAGAPGFPLPADKCAIQTMFSNHKSETFAHRDWFECIFAISAIAIVQPTKP